MKLFFDTETTGLPTRRQAHYKEHDVWPRVVSISWALYDRNELQKHVYTIVRPDGFIIPEDAAKIHGITTEHALANGRPLNEVLQELISDIKINCPEILIAHNIQFDFPVLLCELDRIRMEPNFATIPTCCTMVSSTDLCAILHTNGKGYKWPKLTELHSKLFGSDFSGQHDASNDVLACARCFFELDKLGLVNPSPFSFPEFNSRENDNMKAKWADAAEVETMLEQIGEFSEQNPSFNSDFIKSVSKQYKLRGTLSPKQVNALRNILRGWRLHHAPILQTAN